VSASCACSHPDARMPYALPCLLLALSFPLTSQGAVCGLDRLPQVEGEEGGHASGEGDARARDRLIDLTDLTDLTAGAAFQSTPVVAEPRCSAAGTVPSPFPPSICYLANVILVLAS
jgi:hypothetical protein